MRSYETARSLYSFLGGLTKCVIAIGVIVAIFAASAVSTSSFNNDPSPLALAIAALPGGLIVVAGLYSLAMVQNGRTSVDCAEYAQQSLDISRKQLELSRQMLEQGRESAATYASTVARLAASESMTASSEAGPSYGDRSTSSSAVADPAIPTAALGAAQPPLTIDTPDVSPPAPSKLTYRDGQFLVGQEPFAIKEAAQERLAVLNKSGN